MTPRFSAAAGAAADRPPSAGPLLDDRPPRPTPNQPGTLAEQLEAVGLWLANPYRRVDADAAWQLARRLAIPHARRQSL